MVADHMTDDALTFENRADIQIGKTVRQRREAIGMPQAKLGEAIGVTFQQVQKYEKGTNRIAASKLLLIADALRCDVAELYGLETADIPGSAHLVQSWSNLRPDQQDAVTRIIAAMTEPA